MTHCPLTTSVVSVPESENSMSHGHKLRAKYKVVETLNLGEGMHLRMSLLTLAAGAIKMLWDSRAYSSSSPIVFCSVNSGATVIASEDGGETWRKFLDAPNGTRVVNFCCSGHTFMFQVRDPLTTFIGNAATGKYQEYSGPHFPWHGSQGAAISPSGALILSEYQTGNDGIELSLWRLNRNTDCLEPVLTKVSGRRPPEGDIRHFHTCFFDPYEPQTWYASSGDMLSHNRLWLSENNGRDWTGLAVDMPKADEYGIECPERVLRFTSATVLKPRTLLWATDDGLGVD